MSTDLSDSLNYGSQKQFITKFLSQKYALTKVFQENQQFGIMECRKHRDSSYPLLFISNYRCRKLGEKK